MGDIGKPLREGEIFPVEIPKEAPPVEMPAPVPATPEPERELVPA